MAVPSAPTSLVPTAGDNQVSVAFTPGASSPAILRYEVRLNSGNYYPVAEVASPIVVRGLTNDVEYTIYIRAVNADGNGSSANTSSTPTDASTANDNGYDDATRFANIGAAFPNLNYNDPDD